MMPPCSSLYFLHIPKTAGTSVQQLLQDYRPAAEWMPAQTLPELLNSNHPTINSRHYFGCLVSKCGAGRKAVSR
jgi:hypothetical protein